MKILEERVNSWWILNLIQNSLNFLLSMIFLNTVCKRFPSSLEIPPTLPFKNPGKNAEHSKWALQTFAGDLLAYCHWAIMLETGNDEVPFLCDTFFLSL